MGTAHKKTDTGAIDAELAQLTQSPPLSFDVPSGKYRIGAIGFGSAAAGQNVVLGLTAAPTTYNFVAALGAPGAGVVEVKVQGSLDLTVRKFAQAVQGVTDAVNIAYGAGTKPNPDSLGFYTSQRLSLGVTPIVAGSNVLFTEKVGDRTDTVNPLTLTTTTIGSTTVVFTRFYTTRYVMLGNSALLGDRIAGPYQMLVPMGSVQDPSGNLLRYKCNMIILEGVGDSTFIYEFDLFYSTDEITFTQISFGIDATYWDSVSGAQQFFTEGVVIPPGAGLYARGRSSGVLITEWVDLKINCLYYPLGV